MFEKPLVNRLVTVSSKDSGLCEGSIGYALSMRATQGMTRTKIAIGEVTRKAIEDRQDSSIGYVTKSCDVSGC